MRKKEYYAPRIRNGFLEILLSVNLINDNIISVYDRSEKEYGF